MIDTLYYSLKPLIPRPLQIWIRRRVIRRKLPRVAGVWPIDEGSSTPPQGWKGWPGGKQFALVLTHDVETQKGHDSCRDLAALETDLGFRSSFNFVPEKYPVSRELRVHLTNSGFEVGVHGLLHDGKYLNSRRIFRERAQKINSYLKEWGATGYRSPSMLSNLEWFHDLDISYDASTFDTDPFEPQPDGVGTVFPFWVSNGRSGKGFVELPYTMPQDFTLFVLMEHRDIELWKKKLDWIAQQGGMALVIIHPDYLAFDEKPGPEEYPAHYYRDFLKYVKSTYGDTFWLALPKEIADFSARRVRPTVNQAVLIGPVEETEWDLYVKSHPCGWITHLSVWKNILEQSFPQIKGSLLSIKENGKIRAGLPLYEVKSWLTGKRLVSIPFATLSQPLVTDEADLPILESEALRIARERKVHHLEIRGIGQTADSNQDGRRVSNRFVVHSLDLAMPLETIWRQLHKSCVRRKVTKAESVGVRTRTVEHEEDFREFYRLYCLTRRGIGLPPQPEHFIHTLWRTLSGEGYLEIRLAELEGRVIAGILLLKFGKRVSVEYIVSEDSSRRFGALQYLCWEAIRRAGSNGFEVFDFGRTDERNTGLMDFKGRWGTRTEYLPTTLIPLHSKGRYRRAREYPMAKKGFGSLCRKAPLPVLQMVGNVCYRHLG